MSDETFIRAPASGVLGAFSRLYLPVYLVPVGYFFSARRITFDMQDIAADGSDLSLQTAPLNDPTSSVQYLRSGTRIEWGLPLSPIFPGVPAIPGSQCWDEEEGPQLTGGELFEVQMRLSTGGFKMAVVLEGLLKRVM